jgi:DNA-binding Lrp family transcriptional regulator
MVKDLRTPGPAPRPLPTGLDDIDLRLLELLAADGRMTNAALADAVGIAPSTCLARVRALRDRGAIRGIHADVDLSQLGRPLQAMVSVRLAAHTREQVDAFRSAAPAMPGVLAVFHVTGSIDYLLHVAAADSDALRNFVLDHLVSRPEVAHAETSLIFEYVRGAAALAG